MQLTCNIYRVHVMFQILFQGLGEHNIDTNPRFQEKTDNKQNK